MTNKALLLRSSSAPAWLLIASSNQGNDTRMSSEFPLESQCLTWKSRHWLFQGRFSIGRFCSLLKCDDSINQFCLRSQMFFFDGFFNFPLSKTVSTSSTRRTYLPQLSNFHTFTNLFMSFQLQRASLTQGLYCLQPRDSKFEEVYKSKSKKKWLVLKQIKLYHPWFVFSLFVFYDSSWNVDWNVTSCWQAYQIAGFIVGWKILRLDAMLSKKLHGRRLASVE